MLVIGASVYAVLVAVASRDPGPRTWGLHLPGFLPPASRLLVLALIFGGVFLLWIDLLRTSAARELSERGPATSPRPAERGVRGKRARTPSRRASATLPVWSAWLLLLPWVWALSSFRIQARFLGDATVWMAGLLNGNVNPSNEPLAAAIWMGFANALRSLAFPFTPATVAVLPILCGLLAGALLWAIASEITPKAASRPVVIGVLATLALAQLYFGYIESYPVVSVFMLAFLWQGLRRLRGKGSPFLLAGILGLTLASHLATALLVPAYGYLVLRERRPVATRVLLLLMPVAVTAVVLILLRYPSEELLGAFRIASHAVEPGSATGYRRAYPALSLDHLIDLANGILLAMPVPALLLLARAALVGSRRNQDTPENDPMTLFLALAATPFVLLAASIVLPVVPAQDWDLTAILFLPLAVFGVRLMASIPGSPLRGMSGAALVLIGAGALLSFVLVNASVESGLARFETLVGPGARISDYGRAYGNELLSTFDFQRHDTRRMLIHAQRALDAEPTNPRYWVGKGAALYNLGRYAEAIPVLEEGIRRGPGRDDAYYNLGNCLVHEERYEEAVGKFREALRRSEPRPDYLTSLGVALYHAGKTDSARTVLVEVVRRWPDYALTRALIARYFRTAALDSARASGSPR